MDRPAALLALLAGVGLAALVALLLLGGPMEPKFMPVGRLITGPDGSIDLILPKDGDIACPGEEPCMPTPVPTIDPAMAMKSVGLRVSSISVRVDHVGDYSILLGSASLPNGVLTEADATFADNVRPGMQLRQDVVRLVILGEDGRPRGNKWSDGWHTGLEQVEVRLEFRVKALDGPTTLEFSDIIVR